MISMTENSTQEDEVINIDENSIFYVVAKVKQDIETETPRIGKVKENDEDYLQSFCIADNPLILNEFVTSTIILNQDLVLYFFINLNAVNFLINIMEEIKNNDKISKRYKDISSKYNLLKHKKDLWVYFHQKNIKKYTFLYANDIEQVSKFLENKNVKSKPCIFASLHDLLTIKDNMEKIIRGEEKRYNKLETIEI